MLPNFLYKPVLFPINIVDYLICLQDLFPDSVFYFFAVVGEAFDFLIFAVDLL